MCLVGWVDGRMDKLAGWPAGWTSPGWSAGWVKLVGRLARSPVVQARPPSAAEACARVAAAAERIGRASRASAPAVRCRAAA
jgi:hypothetical protein